MEDRIMKTRVIYVTPDYEDYVDELWAMPEDELLCFAKNCNEIEIFYSLQDFENAFNDECISDLGFIRFINVEG